MSAAFPDGRDDLNEGHGFSRLRVAVSYEVICAWT